MDVVGLGLLHNLKAESPIQSPCRVNLKHLEPGHQAAAPRITQKPLDDTGPDPPVLKVRMNLDSLQEELSRCFLELKHARIEAVHGDDLDPLRVKVPLEDLLLQLFIPTVDLLYIGSHAENLEIEEPGRILFSRGTSMEFHGLRILRFEVFSGVRPAKQHFPELCV